MKILAHAPYVGTTGYNAHCQSFFRSLRNYVDLKIRNSTSTNEWDFAKNRQFPHGKASLDDIDIDLIGLQSYWNADYYMNYAIHNFKPENFEYDIDLVLCEINHSYMHSSYKGVKVLYTVWESTLYPNFLIDKFNSFDQLWVPSEWQKQVSIDSGIIESKVKVVPEGVDGRIFKPLTKGEEKKLDKFRFLHFGRWDDRKNTKNIIKAFKTVFGNNKDVELIICVDNHYSVDGFSNTEERLDHHNLKANNIIIEHFMPREKYVEYLKNGHVFLTCARSEGWNLPLIEAMACGTPSIYSNCSGQLEFAKGKGLAVDIESESSINSFDNSFTKMISLSGGNWYNPSQKDLQDKIYEIYKSYDFYKNKALIDSEEIRSKFTWDNAAKKGFANLQELKKDVDIKGKKYYDIGSNGVDDNLAISCDFTRGPVVSIDGGSKNSKYKIFFVNDKDASTLYISEISSGMWSCCSEDKHIDWRISVYDSEERVQVLKEFKLDLTNKKVKIVNESPAMGDSLAWVGVVDRFQKKHNCEVHYFTPNKFLFEKEYPNIKFYNYSDEYKNKGKFYKEYSIELTWDLDIKGQKWNKYNLQEIASEILGLDYVEVKPKLSKPKNCKNNFSKKYVCISLQSTAQLKYWNNKDGWQEVVNYLKRIGYDVVCIDKFKSYGGDGFVNTIPDGCIDKTGDISLEDRVNDLMHCDFFIGLSSGLAWLAWACHKPVIMIAGFSLEFSEFSTPYRLINKNVCHGCWHNHQFDSSKWSWCPENKNFECSREITPVMVNQMINNVITCENNDIINDFPSRPDAHVGRFDEVYIDNQYQQFVKIEDNDLVLDLGCSSGPFFFHNRNKKMKYIGVDSIMDGLTEFYQFIRPEENPIILHYHLSDKLDTIKYESIFSGKKEDSISITFENLIKLINQKIDFLKFDIEGHEKLFLMNNYSLFKNSVRKFAGEIHFNEKEAFGRENAYNALNRMKEDRDVDFKLFSVNNVDITEYFWSNKDFYNEILIEGYIKDLKTISY